MIKIQEKNQNFLEERIIQTLCNYMELDKEQKIFVQGVMQGMLLSRQAEKSA